MLANKESLIKQRVSGGTGFASAMLRKNADTNRYISHIVEIVTKEKGLPLEVKETIHGYEITLHGNIVWFGRDIDVELLRGTSSTAFEKYLYARIERLENLD